MNTSDVARIEQQLGLKLPIPYKRVLLQYPFALFAGTGDWSLSDDPNKVVELTFLYCKSLPTAASQSICIGDDGDCAPYVLDLSTGKVEKTKAGRVLESYAGFDSFMDALMQDYNSIVQDQIGMESAMAAHWFGNLLFLLIAVIGIIALTVAVVFVLP